METESKSDIRRLYRSEEDRVIAGVCGGIGNHIGIDPVIIRLAWVVLTIIHGAGLFLYLIAWLLIPRKPWI